jgi:putative peptidoglycan lipid II flippase
VSLQARRLLTGLAGAAALIAGITVLSRVLGFGRWFAQSYAVGATATGSAYATANQLPNVLFEVVAGGALAGAVVPLLAGPLARGMRRDVDRIASALLTWALLVLLPAAVLLALVARPVVGLLLPDAWPDTTAGGTQVAPDPALVASTLDLATVLLVMFAPQVVLYGIGVVLTGILQAQRRFAWPAAAPIASTVVVVGSYLTFRSLAAGEVSDPAALSDAAVAWLGWGTTAGVAAMSLPLLIPVVRSGVRLRPTLTFPDGVARRALRLALAGIGGLLAQQAAVLVTVRLANTRGEEGTINLFQYAQAVYFLPYAVLAVPLATAAFPRLAEHAATGHRDAYARLVSVSTRAVLLVATVGAAALIAAAPAVATLFAGIDASGDPEAVAAMAPTLALLAPGLLGYALIFQLSRVLFALERGRAAVVAVATGWLAVAVASIVAVLVLAPDGGDGRRTLAGLAVGSTLGMVIAGAVLLVAVERAAGRPAVAGTVRTVLVATLGALPGSVLGRLVADRLLGPDASWGSALAGGLLGGALAALLVLGIALLGDRGTLVGALRADRGRGAMPAGTALQSELAPGPEPEPALHVEPAPQSYPAPQFDPAQQSEPSPHPEPAPQPEPTPEDGDDR